MKKISIAGRLIATGAAVFLLTAACTAGYYKTEPVNASNALTDDQGMVVYTFDKDTAYADSSCYGPCATTWPPVAPGVIAGVGVSQIERTDGSAQATYKGSPLYHYVGDAKPGDRNGDGVGGVWHLVEDKPVPQAQPTYSYGGSSFY